MTDYQLKHEVIDEITLYKANTCPAELLLPYNLSTNPDKSIISVFHNSKFKQALVNMDSPLLMAMTILVLLHLMLTFVLSILASLNIASMVAPAHAFILGPLSLFFLTIPLYATIVLCNLKAGGGRNWKNRLSGPTHIGLTDSGFKLWWQGAAFYNYPNLALWSDIFYIDFKEDMHQDEQYLHFIYQSGFGRRTIELPLRGFINVEDAQLVLDYFARNVILDYQSDKFKTEAEMGFENILKRFVPPSSPLYGLSDQEREEYVKLEQDNLDSPS